MKGFWQSSSSANVRYTFINFKDNLTLGSEDLLPDIYINTQNLNENIPSGGTDQSGGTNYGHIVTTKCINTFKDHQIINTDCQLQWKTGANLAAYIERDQSYSADNGSLDIQDIKQINLITPNGIRISTTDTLTTIRNKLQLQSTTGTNAEAANADVCISGFSNFAKAVKITSTLTVSSACNADYFNATSDMRAKEEIIPLDFNALDFIKNLNLYSFNYKHSHSPSIGVIAQEIKDIDIQGFSLVDNKEASGENNDYMSVKESKLIYILCKAVKELEAEVESLKQQLNYGK